MAEHSSDCALHNAPALPPGPCSCGADAVGTLRAFSPDKSIFPEFRDFYREHNPQFRGQWPCPIGTPLEEFHRALADTAADYFDVIRTVLERAALGGDA